MSPYGCGTARFWNGLRSGASQLVPETAHDAARLRTARVGALRATDPCGYRSFVGLPRLTQMAILAATEAWLDAGVPSRPPDRTRVGLYAGTSYGLLDELASYEADLARRAFRAARPSVYQELTLGALTGHIGIALDIHGPIVPLGHGWLSALDALDLAMADLRDGLVDMAVVAAVEALGPSMVAQMQDEAPDLECIGEGALALVVERGDDRRRKGATYGRLGDVAQRRAADATSHAEALAGAMRLARGSDDAPGAVFGVGGVGAAIDRLESAALSLAFGSDRARVPVTRAGALIGHAASCTALFNLAAAALAARHGSPPASRAAASAAGNGVSRATQTGGMLATGWSSHGQYAAVLLSA